VKPQIKVPFNREIAPNFPQRRRSMLSKIYLIICSTQASNMMSQV